jgi:multidrug efflux pump subunit AcrA (membrane-fusion protein)
MAPIHNDQIFELLQSLDSKLDSQQRTLAETQTRLASTDAILRSLDDSTKRSWNLTETRLALLERERAFVKDVERLDERLSAVEADGTRYSTKFGIVYGGLALVGSGVVSALVSYFMKHLGAP